ncbi:MAG: hypothetical protein JWN98_642, partial [Abditibacteriota bacterium]|nr:hypothetical protein [Abditibacteriota bacterium]
DDALALAVILNSPELQLRGVTTVFRNAPRRAILTRTILDVWERTDVDLASGISKPLLEAFDPRLGAQFQLLEEDVLEEPLPHAVDYLVSAVGEEDEQSTLTLVPIGPLTNIAAAIVRKPELVNRTRIVLMGGFWKGDHAEWNIKCDPEAAAIVFNSGAQIDMVGLDVTLRCRLSPAHIEQFAARGTARATLLHQLIALWEGEHVTLHDPLAVLTLFSDVVTWEERRIEVALCGPDRGKTLIVEGEPNCRIAVDVDVDAALDLFMQRALG